MSWSYLVKLAAAIFVAQVEIGFLDGFFALGGAGIAWFFGGHFVSLVTCAAIFALFASRQPIRPFAHAWIALLIHLAAGFLLAQALKSLVGSTPLALVAIEMLIVVCALVVGTAFGVCLRHRVSRPTDA